MRHLGTITLPDTLAVNDGTYLCRLLTGDTPIAQRPMHPNGHTTGDKRELVAVWRRGELHQETGDAPVNACHVIHPDGRIVATERGPALHTGPDDAHRFVYLAPTP